MGIRATRDIMKVEIMAAMQCGGDEVLADFSHTCAVLRVKELAVFTCTAVQGKYGLE
jgi:hypothetical protein